MDSFLIDEIKKDNLKGKNLINPPKKYFFNDLEETHLMENLIYNELIKRGYKVSLGGLIYNGKNEYNISYRKELEIDFIAKKNNKTYYIQNAYQIYNEDKKYQEIRPFTLLNEDSLDL